MSEQDGQPEKAVAFVEGPGEIEDAPEEAAEPQPAEQ